MPANHFIQTLLRFLRPTSGGWNGCNDVLMSVCPRVTGDGVKDVHMSSDLEFEETGGALKTVAHAFSVHCKSILFYLLSLGAHRRWVPKWRTRSSGPGVSRTSPPRGMGFSRRTNPYAGPSTEKMWRSSWLAQLSVKPQTTGWVLEHPLSLLQLISPSCLPSSRPPAAFPRTFCEG